MSSWVWLNFPLCGLFMLAVAGVPLWMVITRPDTGPQRSPTSSLLHGRTPPSRVPNPPVRRVAPAAPAGQADRRWPAGVS